MGKMKSVVPPTTAEGIDSQSLAPSMQKATSN